MFNNSKERKIVSREWPSIFIWFSV